MDTGLRRHDDLAIFRNKGGIKGSDSLIVGIKGLDSLIVYPSRYH